MILYGKKKEDKKKKNRRKKQKKKKRKINIKGNSGKKEKNIYCSIFFRNTDQHKIEENLQEMKY